MSDRSPGFATLAIHAGDPPAPPLPDDGGFAAPLGSVLEERIAALEGGTAAVAVSAGPTAALVALQALLGPGDEFVAAAGLRNRYAGFGWAMRPLDLSDPAALAAALSPRTKAILVDSMTADGVIADVAALSTPARAARVPLLVDNTIATPCLFRPIEHGADAVIYRDLTFLSGCGGVAGGLIVDGGSFDWLADARFPTLSRPRVEHGGVVIGERFGNFALAVAGRTVGLADLGAPLSAIDSDGVLRGLASLSLRMTRHGETARLVARHLASHSAVDTVGYAGLPNDPRNPLAARDWTSGVGGLVLARFGDGGEAVFARRLRLVRRGDAPGGARSTATVVPGTVRLWIGLEDAADILDDLDQALGA